MAIEGASQAEVIFDAARRDDVDSLLEVLDSIEDKDKITEAINAKDSLGNTALHMSALNRSFETMEILLSHDGVELDPVNRIDQDTPLHSAVRCSMNNPKDGFDTVEMLIDAGCDPQIRNKYEERPIDMCAGGDAKLISILRKAERNASDVPTVEEDDDVRSEDGSGSASDSDSGTE